MGTSILKPFGLYQFKRNMGTHKTTHELNQLKRKIAILNAQN